MKDTIFSFIYVIASVGLVLTTLYVADKLVPLVAVLLTVTGLTSLAASLYVLVKVARQPVCVRSRSPE